VAPSGCGDPTCMPVTVDVIPGASTAIPGAGRMAVDEEGLNALATRYRPLRS